MEQKRLLMNNCTPFYLKFVNFSDLCLWDFKRYVANNISSTKYKIVKLADYIQEENIRVKPFENPTDDYAILGVNNKTGLFDAYVEKGSKINQPYKVVKDGFLAYNPYRVNVGSIGLKTEKQKYKYISPAYVVFSCKKGLLSEFLYILFRTNKFNELIRENTTGSVRQTLSFTSMGNIKIPLPSENEQKRLIKLYKQVENQAQENINLATKCTEKIINILFSELGLKLNDYSKSNKTLMFTNFRNLKRWDYEYNSFFSQNIIDFGNKYKTVRFGSCVNLYQYGTSNKASKTKTGYPVLRMNNIIDGTLDISDLKYINTLKESEIKNLKLEKGDLIFNRTNSKELVGKMCVFDEDKTYIFASYLIKLKIDTNKISPYYVNYLFNSPILRTQIDATSRQVTGQANINTDELSNFLIPLPPLNIQNELVNRLNKIRSECDKLQLDALNNKTNFLSAFEKELFE